MSSNQINFLQLRRPEQIEKVLKAINVWTNIILHTGPHKEFKVQSLQLSEQAFELTFTALNPEVGSAYLRFVIDDFIFQIDGDLQLQNGGYVFIFKEFSRELKRRILRVEIPKDYPAYFILLQAAGQALEEETQLLDFHTDGFLISSRNPLPIKAGDIIRGHVRVSKFNEVQVAGVIRHCIKKDGATMAGVEIHHHEFGSEEKMIELMAFYKRDVKNRKPS